MTKYIAAIDQGTSSTRCLIFDHEGQVVCYDQREHEQIYPQPGWVEHNPEEIWLRTREVVGGALERGGLTSRNLAAIGITNQRETTVVWDRKTGRPFANAIVWQDTRTASQCNDLMQEGGDAVGGIDRFRAKTGLPLATYFSGPKIAWLLEHVTGLRTAAERGDALFGTIDSFLIWHLTGGVDGGIHCTDVTNASRTMLMNIETLTWDEEILDILRIPRAMLPAIRSSSEIYGEARGELGGVPVAGNLGDQHAALVGQTCFQAGEAKNTYGSGCFVLLNTGSTRVPSHHGLITTVAYQLGQQPVQYALEGSIAVTGMLVRWLRDNMQMIASSDEIEPLARSVPDNGGIYIVPAFSGLFAPYWKSNARGVIVGLTGYVQRAHVARAVLEATALQTREVLDAMAQDAGVPIQSLKVDGGMVKNDLLMQIQADVLGIPVIRSAIAETTSLGAAYAAGLATGFWNSPDALCWKSDRIWHPAIDEQQRNHHYAGWKKAVLRSFDWLE